MKIYQAFITDMSRAWLVDVIIDLIADADGISGNLEWPSASVSHEKSGGG